MSNIPPFRVPASAEVVGVRILDTDTRIVAPLDMVDRTIKGNESLDCPTYPFLIEHKSGRKILFDLGVRKDLENMAPVIRDYFSKSDTTATIKKGVRELLEEHNVSGKDIEAIVWSHWHWDHVGDPSTFETSTSLIVGPGFKEVFVPGYPTNPGSPMLDSDYAGREVRELNFSAEKAIKIGHFDALDHFGDGSFYLLNAPGHTVGHICGLARVTASPPSFILMGADTCHHSGEMRPSKWLQLPSEINVKGSSCPGAAFEHIYRNGDPKIPFYGQKRPGMMFGDADVADQTIEKLQEADVSGNVLVVIAHDNHLKGVVKFFPEYANDFLAESWIEKTRWKFLGDFKEALVQKSTL
ncbi:beta-lactamase-like protein [Ilyonectria destructans]|nr:beta-lactamase-like protein [Ilyonectria destructans]